MTISLLKTLAHNSATVVWFVSLKLLVLFSVLPIETIVEISNYFTLLSRFCLPKTPAAVIYLLGSTHLYIPMEVSLPFKCWNNFEFKLRGRSLHIHLPTVNIVPIFGSKQVDLCMCVSEKKMGKNETVYQLFINFKKSCDPVRKKVLYNILNEFGVPMNLLKLLKLRHTQTHREVRVGKNFSDIFSTMKY
jgi:hypothetical protein